MLFRSPTRKVSAKICGALAPRLAPEAAVTELSRLLATAGVGGSKAGGETHGRFDDQDGALRAAGYVAAAGGAGNQILQRLEQQPGTKVVPKPGMAIPFYWQEGIEYGINRRNTFAMNEFVGIRRSDGDIKFGTIMDIAQGREGNVYQVLVDGNGSYQQGKSADSLYKINYDVTSQGFKLELKKQDEAPKGLFGW